MSVINKKNLLQFAFVNLDTLVYPVRGIVMNCHGMNDMTQFSSSPRPAKDLGEKGVVYVFPYYAGWAWCNENTVAFLDSLLDAVYEALDLPADLPYVLTGGSMGGLTSLMYSMLGSRTPLAVGGNCPVTDIALAFSCGGDLTRSIYNAHVRKGEDFEVSLARINPMEHTDSLPRIPYLIVGGEKDGCVTVDRFLRPFAEKMKASGQDITLLSVPGMDHCQIQQFEDAYQTYLAFVLKNLGL